MAGRALVELVAAVAPGLDHVAERRRVGTQYLQGGAFGRGGKVVTVTRHTANPLRAHADAALVISAHDPAAHIEQLLYRSSLQYLLDFLFVLLCRANPERHRQLGINLERIQHLLDA